MVTTPPNRRNSSSPNRAYLQPMLLLCLVLMLLSMLIASHRILGTCEQVTDQTSLPWKPNKNQPAGYSKLRNRINDDSDARYPPSRDESNRREYHGKHEILFVSLLASLLREPHMVPPGAILDVGAQFGEQAAHMAFLQPNREVYAMDPSPSNTDTIRKRYRKSRFSNLYVITAGVGQRPVNLTLAEAASKGFDVSNMANATQFSVHSLDSFFHDRPLGLAHLDVEGMELAVLQGGVETIQTHRPFFTTEVRVHKDPAYTRALLDFVKERIGYDSYLIDEVCGDRMDYRNLLHIPRERSVDLVFSDAFNFAIASSAVQRVTAGSSTKVQANIFEAVVPCCAQGRDCCPKSAAGNCCTEAMVERHYATKPNNSFRGFLSSAKQTSTIWYNYRVRSENYNSQEKAKESSA